MPLFIANATRANQVLILGVPGMRNIRMDITSGHQGKFPVDLTSDQRNSVMEQLHRYGAVERRNVHGQVREFTGLVYSFDKPVSEDEIAAGNEEQLDHAQDRSVTQATRSALAADLAHRDQDNRRKGKRKSKKVSVEVLRHEDGIDTPMMGVTIDDEASTRAKLPI